MKKESQLAAPLPSAGRPTRSGSSFLHRASSFEREPVCLLPGPVAVSPRVRAAFRRPIVYHRADEFLPLYEGVRAKLAALAGGVPVAVFVGSGTLANDAVAAALAADPARDNGLMLATGEFGARLVKQAKRFGLTPRVLTWDWGRAWDLAEVEAAIRALPPGGWVWGVHHETSTGVLNDLPGLVRVAAKYGVRVCVDCVSSLAAVPADLSGVYLATGASGKAVGSYAGLAFVFARPESLAHLHADAVPTYLDVAAGLAAPGPRFTVPSPLVAALDAALDGCINPAARFARVRDLGTRVRAAVVAAGLTPVADPAAACPALVTFAPPPGMTSAAFVTACRAKGYLVAGQSGYLAERGLVQIAVMGALTRADVEPIFDLLTAKA